MRDNIKTTGIYTIKGKEYTVQTWWPKGRKHNNYRLYMIWAFGERGTVFASEEALHIWVAKQAEAQTQARLI